MKNYQRILSGIIEQPAEEHPLLSKKSENEIVQKQVESKE